MRSPFANVLLVLLSALIGAAIAEGALRYAGFGPRTVVVNSHFKNSWAKPHPVYGWENQAGTFNSLEEGQVPMTFLADGTRRSGAAGKQATRDIILLGGSWTQGYAVRDEETYAAHLNEALPARRILNYASGGWGTYQSYLRMRDLLQEDEDRQIELIIYGLYSDHRHRNIAPKHWIYALTDPIGRYLKPPSVRSFFGDELTEHPMEIIGLWPLETTLATAALMHSAYLDIRNPPRTSTHMYRVMFRILSMMDAEARRNDAAFLVVVLDQLEPLLRGWLGEAGIEFLDCTNPAWGDPKFQVGGDGHPSALQHSLWAACIGERLK